MLIWKSSARESRGFLIYWGPRRNLQSCGGESGGTSRPYQLAERFGHCDLVAEREK